MKVLELIKENKNWREILAAAPYNIKIKEKEDLALLKYDMIESAMGEQIVQECRGLIVDTKTEEIVCRPFYKFFNALEGNAAELKGKIRVEEKLDGSLIKVYYYKGEWRVATNGMIDAADAQRDNFGSTFRELFDEAMGELLPQMETIFAGYEEYTMMFELVSPVQRIVVKYPETKLYAIGIKHNRTGKEFHVEETDLGVWFDAPEIYTIDTIEEALEIAETLCGNQEGFILMDEAFNRIKVKGNEYLALSRIVGNRNFSPGDFIELVMNEKQDDLLGHFPEFTPYIEQATETYLKYVSFVQEEIERAPWDEDKKTFALAVKDSAVSALLFKMYGDRELDWKAEKDYNFKMIERYFVEKT